MCSSFGITEKSHFATKFINIVQFLFNMPFSKSFPKTSKTSVYPQWEEISLTDAEEKEVEQKSKEENIKLFKDCIDDAKSILIEKGLNESASEIIKVAISLFEKRASHEVYHKENKAKEKFDEMFNK